MQVKNRRLGKWIVDGTIINPAKERLTDDTRQQKCQCEYSTQYRTGEFVITEDTVIVLGTHSLLQVNREP
ncbi:MAG: hypothetical protein ABH805_00895 [Candidatus Nealsonbacteria bacterium]